MLRYDPAFPDSMVVATVNSEPITVGEVLEPVWKSLGELIVEYKVSAEQRAQIREAWVKRMLADVVDRKLRVHGLTSDLTNEQWEALEEYLDKSWEEYTVQLRKEQGVSTMQELSDRVEREGTNLANVKRYWREGSMAHQFVLLKVNSSYEPTNEELRDYYEEHQADWGSPARVKWQQIVLRRQKGELGEVAARARALLEILQDGADFAEVAQDHSEGPTKAQGGNWDWTETKSLTCREVAEFLSAGKVGSTSEVIRHEDDFQIVKILARDGARRKSFEQVEEEVRDALKRAHRDRLAREAARELVDKAVIQTVFGNKWKFEQPVAEVEPEKKPEHTPKSSTESPFGKVLNRLRPGTDIFQESLEKEDGP